MILALFGLAGLGYYVFRTNLDGLQRLNRENLGWSANQLQLELNRFQLELAELKAGFDGVSPETVSNRFDILWSRVALVQKGSLGERLRCYDIEERVLDDLSQSLRDTEPIVMNLRDGNLTVIDTLIESFSVHEVPMREFGRDVFFGEEREIADVRNNLRQSSMFTAVVTLLAFVTSAVTLWMINRESTANREMAARNLALRNAAERANETKSRFLTMMSHELRTPMNGVLGMLSLAKQSGLPKPQMRLVEQAERSGRQMISMLSDILDYSALQDEQMTLENKAFEPRLLATAIQELFDSVARREGIDFSVSVSDGCPTRLNGDFRRLRQTVAHFASYIVETAGTRLVEISMTHVSGNLIVTIEFDYGEGNGSKVTWRPEILLGNSHYDNDQFASDALGPAVARGILDRMGGSVALDYPSDERIAIVLSAPCQAVELKELCVHIEAESEALKMICRVSLSGEDIVIHDPGSPDPVHVVLIEAGGAEEAERVARIADDYPSALLVAIGNPVNPADFEATVDIPLDINSLRESVLQRKSA